MDSTSIATIEAHSIRIPRDYAAVQGSAGSPADLGGRAGSSYSTPTTYNTVYSNCFESMVVKVTAEDGTVGWGEAQAPVLPEVAETIIHRLFAPLLCGGTIAPLAVQQILYEAMRVRGHFGGFYVDAMSAIDCALWDIAGKRAGVPVYQLLGGPVRKKIPVYISGLVGQTLEQRIADAHQYVLAGYRAFKVFAPGPVNDCLNLVRHLREEFQDSIEIFVDALWRLDEHGALKLAESLAAYDVGWLESPLAPEDLEGHRRLAELSPIPIAAGECYRTRYECLPWLKHRAVHLLQPDIGRSGISEGLAIASLAAGFSTPVSIHLSIALGPQIASAVQAAAAMPNLRYCELNPHVLKVAASVWDLSGYSISADGFSLPLSPGLGVEPKPEFINQFLG